MWIGSIGRRAVCSGDVVRYSDYDRRSGIMRGLAGPLSVK